MSDIYIGSSTLQHYEFEDDLLYSLHTKHSTNLKLMIHRDSRKKAQENVKGEYIYKLNEASMRIPTLFV